MEWIPRHRQFGRDRTGRRAEFGPRGIRVIVHGRDRTRTETVARAIRDSGGTAAGVVGDLATDEGALNVFNAATAACGDIDILINNAGSYAARPWLENDCR